MTTIVVTPENKKEFNFLKYLLNKLKYDPAILYDKDKDKEDIVLLEALGKK